MSKLSTQLVPTRYWELSTEGHSRPTSLKGGLKDVALYIIEFLSDGIPLSGTPLWNRAPQLIAPAVARCLVNLRGENGALILSVRSGPDYPRSVGRRKVNLRAEEAVYLDYIVSEKIENFWWFTYRFDDTRHSELLFEPPDELIDPIIKDYWEWHSVNGYVVPETTVPKIPEWVTSYNKARWKTRLGHELDDAWLFFEDWADACAVRLWTKRWTEDEIRSRLRLTEINQLLDQLHPSKY